MIRFWKCLFITMIVVKITEQAYSNKFILTKLYRLYDMLNEVENQNKESETGRSNCILTLILFIIDIEIFLIILLSVVSI
jgi:hypothetical protein